MARNNNYYKATLILAAVGLGFLITYPWQSNFWDGLFCSAFSAALVGGLADWFAVTALFRRPLGIRPGRIVRTEIIPRNRQRIFNDLAEMAQELLTRDALKRQLQSYDVAGLIIDYVENHGGKADLKQAVVRLTEILSAEFDLKTLIYFTDRVLSRMPDSAEIVFTTVNSVAGKLAQNDEVMDVLLDELLIAARHPQTGRTIFSLVQRSLDRYTGGKDRRKLVNSFFIEPVQLSEMAQNKLIGLLSEMRLRPDHPWRSKMKGAFLQLLSEQSDQSKWNGWQSLLKQYVNDNLETWLSASRISGWFEKLAGKLWNGFTGNQALQKSVDEFAKKVLLSWVESNYNSIGELVKTGLSRLDNEELVTLIETKAGNDLQMIRINGTIVGGLTGMLIYLLNSLIALRW